MIFSHLQRLSKYLLLALLVACNSQTEDTLEIDDAVESNISNSNGNKVSERNESISLANTDSALGKRFFIQCQACHTLEAGADNMIGPNLWGILGRTAGTYEGFEYSPGLAEAGFIWSLDNLDQYLTKPNDLIAETTMIFTGIPDEKMRRDLLAYLVEATTPQ